MRIVCGRSIMGMDRDVARRGGGVVGYFGVGKCKL